MKFCPYCGAPLVGSAVSFCAECGKPLPGQKDTGGRPAGLAGRPQESGAGRERKRYKGNRHSAVNLPSSRCPNRGEKKTRVTMVTMMTYGLLMPDRKRTGWIPN